VKDDVEIENAAPMMSIFIIFLCSIFLSKKMPLGPLFDSIKMYY